jgi:tetratricopeptide (TPR) repeat protein
MRAFSLVISITALFIILGAYLQAQDSAPPGNFQALYDQGKFTEALSLVTARLEAIYETRVEAKRIPTEFITLKSSEKDIDLKEVFRSRQAQGFFIEVNPELADLHMQAARCYGRLSKYNESVSHYTQSLRFRKVEYRRDDETYYEMSQIYRKMGLFDGYIRALESAFTLNPEKYDYSLELGTSLSKTARRKKSLFHVERYIQNAPGTVPPELYLLAGNLNEDLGYYLETQKYYLKYLSIKGDDGVMHFALGYVAYARTGNHALARESFTRALELLPAGDLYRRSKCHEYSGDMALNDLRYRNAIGDYMETLAYQEKVKSEIDATGKKLAALKSRINAIKTDLLNRQDYEKFEEYELLEDERGKMELAL